MLMRCTEQPVTISLEKLWKILHRFHTGHCKTFDLNWRWSCQKLLVACWRTQNSKTDFFSDFSGGLNSFLILCHQLTASRSGKKKERSPISFNLKLKSAFKEQEKKFSKLYARRRACQSTGKQQFAIDFSKEKKKKSRDTTLRRWRACFFSDELAVS